jgi:hypothetical protein
VNLVLGKPEPKAKHVANRQGDQTHQLQSRGHQSPGPQRPRPILEENIAARHLMPLRSQPATEPVLRLIQCDLAFGELLGYEMGASQSRYTAADYSNAIRVGRGGRRVSGLNEL